MSFRSSILLLIVASAPLAGQTGDIRGIVADSASGERIPFATVLVSGTNKGSSTNLNGFYLLGGLQPGVYTVRASSIGYLRDSLQVTVRAGEVASLNFELLPQPVEFSEVVVTERARRELSEINTSVHVLDVSDMKAVPVTLQPDVFRAIQILPGVVSTSDVNSHFYVRGGAGDQNLILLDGMKIYNPFHAFGIFSIFDADLIKTTEVYTGAFPPGFGGRLSSVVSMLSRDGNRKAVAGKAEVNLASTKVQVEGPVVADLRVLGSGRVSTFSGALDKFLRKDVPLSFYDAFIKVTGENLEAHSRYGFTGFYSGDNLRSKNPQTPDYSWRNHAIGFWGGGLIDDRLFVDVVAYENLFEASRIPKSGTGSPANTYVKETGVRANATRYTGSRDLYFFGFEFSFPTLQYNLTNNLGIQRKLENSFVDFWTWFRYQTTLGPFQVDGGIHADVGSLFQRPAGVEVLEPRLNVSVLLFEGWRAKFSAGRFSQQIITVNNEDDVIALFDAWIKVPDDIQAERSDHFVAGIEGNILPELSASVQGYLKNYSSLVTYNRDKVDARDPDYVAGTGKAYGVETLVRYGLPWFDVYASHTMGWTTVSSHGFRYPPRYDRRHTVNLLTVFHVLENAEVTLRWEYGSGFPYTQSVGYYDRLSLERFAGDSFLRQSGSPYIRLGDKNASRLPAYHRLDAGATYRFRLGALRLTAGLSIANVYNERNIFYFDRTNGTTITMLPFFPSFQLSAEF